MKEIFYSANNFHQQKNLTEEAVETSHLLPTPAKTYPCAASPGEGVESTPINPKFLQPKITGRPPTTKEVFEQQRASLSNRLAERDRSLFRSAAWAWNANAAYRGARLVEPPTILEKTRLHEIKQALASAPEPAMSKLLREQETIEAAIEQRGQWRGPLWTLGVTLADSTIDRILLPHDHIKYGTLIGDFLGATGAMFIPSRWCYKALAMMGAHCAGRIYDHFLQDRQGRAVACPRTDQPIVP